jgi:hypothetical protein
VAHEYNHRYTVIATSDSGPENFILMVLASSFLNTFMYGVVFFALSKAVSAGRDG